MGKERITIAHAIIRCLEEERVKYVFGHPGGAILPLYDAIYHSKIVRHILVRHEQCGAHMAEDDLLWVVEGGGAVVLTVPHGGSRQPAGAPERAQGVACDDDFSAELAREVAEPAPLAKRLRSTR